MLVREFTFVCYRDASCARGKVQMSLLKTIEKNGKNTARSTVYTTLADALVARAEHLRVRQGHLHLGRARRRLRLVFRLLFLVADVVELALNARETNARDDDRLKIRRPPHAQGGGRDDSCRHVRGGGSTRGAAALSPRRVRALVVALAPAATGRESRRPPLKAPTEPRDADRH